MAILKFEEFVKQAGGTPEDVQVVEPEEVPLSERGGFLSRVKTDLQQRSKNVDEIGRKTRDPLQGTLRTAGQVAGGVGDVATQAITTIPGAEKALTTIGKEIGEIGAVQDIAQGYKSWAEKHPDASKNLEAVVNIGSLIPGVKAVQLGAKGAMKGTGVAATGAKAALKPVASITGKGFEKTGQKVQQSVIRPSTHDVSDGFKIENVAKYKVGGTLPETIAKTHVKMNEFTEELTKKLEGSTSAVNLNDVLKQTASELTKNKGKSFGDNTAIMRVIENLQSEIEQVAGKNGLVDLIEATNVKRGAGQKGAWSYNRPEPDASAIEKVYTTFYSVLKNEIEKNAPEGVREINQRLSELIPIQTAALRRLPVEQRNNALSLTDNIGLISAVFDPHALLILGASKAARSGRVGNALVNLGQKLQGKKN